MAASREAFRPDGETNRIFDPEGVFERAFGDRAPAIQKDTPPGMPSIKNDMNRINKERVEAGVPQLHNSTQGDGALLRNDEGQHPQLSGMYLSERAETEAELMREIRTGYVGGAFRKRINEALMAFFDEDLPETCVGLSGREVLYPMHRAAYDIQELNPKWHLPAIPSIEWSGYGQIALGDKTPFFYRSDGFLRVPMEWNEASSEPNGMINANTLRESIKALASSRKGISYLAVASPGNPGLALTHDTLVELVGAAAEHGIPVLYDNFYGTVSSTPTFDLKALKQDLSKEELQHLMVLMGTTKFESSNTRSAILFTPEAGGVAHNIIRSTRSQVSAGTNNNQPKNMAGLITYLQQGNNPEAMLGEFGQVLAQRREELFAALEHAGIPYISGGGYYALAHLNPRGLSTPDSYSQLGIAYASGASFTNGDGEFGRLSAATNKETIQAIAELNYDNLRG